MSINFIFFAVLSALAIASAIAVIGSRNPVASAMALVFHFFMLAGLYLTLHAQFIAVIQILVYAGAIMVLVVFVIMLLNLRNEEDLKEKLNFRKWVGLALSGAFAVQLAAALLVNYTGREILPASSFNNGTAQAIGKELFTNYLFPFEAISLLLLAAIVGSVVLAKRKVE